MPIPGIPERHRRPITLSGAEHEAEDTEIFRHDVKTKGGTIGITIGANALVAIVTAVLTWFASHGTATVADCPSKAQFDGLSHQVDELHTNLGALVAKVNQDGDRAHNDMELVKLRLEVLGRK